MKAKSNHVPPGATLWHRDEQVTDEIKKFFSALESYPQRVANEPGISFRQHLARLLRPQEAPQPTDRTPA
jgi:hypothetical protein